MAEEVVEPKSKELKKFKVKWMDWPEREVEAKDKDSAYREWCRLSGLHPTVEEKSAEADGYVAVLVK